VFYPFGKLQVSFTLRVIVGSTSAERVGWKRARVATERGTNTIGDARLLKLEINRFCVVREGVLFVCVHWHFVERTSKRASERAHGFVHLRFDKSKRPGAISSPSCLAIFGVFSV